MSDTPVGKILDESAERDAIHMAIAPVVAAQRLLPGDHVGIEKGIASSGDNPIGIVDPFLKRSVQPGQRFYVFLYPKSVTGMRHHWSHPAFADKAEEPTPEQVEIAQSKVWIAEIAERCGCSYESLINAVDRDSYVAMGQNETYKDVLTATIHEELRKHCSIVLGRELDSVHPFTCSC